MSSCWLLVSSREAKRPLFSSLFLNSRHEKWGQEVASCVPCWMALDRQEQIQSNWEKITQYSPWTCTWHTQRLNTRNWTSLQQAKHIFPWPPHVNVVLAQIEWVTKVAWLLAGILQNVQWQSKTVSNPRAKPSSVHKANSNLSRNSTPWNREAPEWISITLHVNFTSKKESASICSPAQQRSTPLIKKSAPKP